MATADRVTRTAVHVLADADTEPESNVRVTRTAVHAMADTDTEPVSPIYVTRTAVHGLIDADTEPASPVFVTRTAVHVLMSSTYSLGSINFNIRLKMRVSTCVVYDTRWRLRIRNATNTANALSVESVSSGDPALIIEPPQVDGSTFDPLSGRVTIGAARVMVADAPAGTCASPDDTNRAVTSVLADSTGNNQLIGRLAYLEVSRNGLATPYQPFFAGYITGLTLVDGIAWDIQIAHTSRDDQTSLAWATSDFPNAVAKSCLVGGPVTATVPSANVVAKQTFQGFWKATVKGIYGTFVHLDIDEDDCLGFPPQDMRPYLDDADRWYYFGLNNDNAFQRRVFRWAQGLAQPYFVMGYPSNAARIEWQSNPTGKPAIRGYMPRLKVNFTERNGTPLSPVPSYPMMGSYTQKDGDTGRDSYSKAWENLGNHFYVAWPSAGGTVAVNDQVSFSITADDVSELAPLWVYDHPVDLLYDMLTDLGSTVNTANLTAVRAAVGDFRLAMRVTNPPTVAAALEMFGRAFGLGVRYEDNGTRTIFCWRTQQTPVVTITINDLVAPAGMWWQTQEQSRIFSVEWQTQRFDVWPGQDQAQVSPTSRAFDGVTPFAEAPITFQTGNVQPRGTRTESVTVPGMLLSSTGTALNNVVDVCGTWSEQIFGVFANGAITTEIEVFHELEDGPMPHVGDQIMLELSPRPGFDVGLTPVSQRGIPERCLVISRTPTDTGYKLVLLKGPSDVAAPIDTGVPFVSAGTLNFAFTAVKGAGAFSSNTVVVQLVDNTNFTSDLQVLVEYLINPSSTPDAGTSGALWPDALDPLTTLNMGGLPSGATVWVRLWNFATYSYTAWQSVTLDGATSSATGTIVQTPTVQLTVDNTGDVDVTVNAGGEAVKAYAAASDTAFPSVATILAGSTDTTAPYTFNNLINIDRGETAYVGTIVEDAEGNTSIPAYAALQRAAAVEEALSVTFTGGITAADFRDLQVPYACEVLSWTVLGNATGSIVVDVWTDTLANYPPTVADSIAGTGKPTVTSATNATGNVSLWSDVTLAKDDIVRFYVDSVSTFTQVTVSLTVRRT